VQPDPKTGTQLNKSQLAEESIVVVVGGNDTGSICMAFASYYLLLSPDKYKRPQAEADLIWNGTTGSCTGTNISMRP
jgi:cytochrome P450